MSFLWSFCWNEKWKMKEREWTRERERNGKGEKKIWQERKRKRKWNVVCLIGEQKKNILYQLDSDQFLFLKQLGWPLRIKRIFFLLDEKVFLMSMSRVRKYRNNTSWLVVWNQVRLSFDRNKNDWEVFIIICQEKKRIFAVDKEPLERNWMKQRDVKKTNLSSNCDYFNDYCLFWQYKQIH